MHQTLFFIPREIGGYPLLGFGLALAAWAVFSAVLLFRLVRKQGWSSDTVGYLPVLAVVAAAIIWILPAISKEQGLPIYGYGTMMLVAVLSGAGLAAYRAKREGVDPEVIYTLAFWMVVPGIIGARLFHVIEYWPTTYWPVYGREGLGPFLGNLINLSNGGLVVYGSFFGAVLGLGAFVFRFRMPIFKLLDLAAPSMALGVAIGRIGCLLNGCCYGGICHTDFGIHFPAGSYAYESQVVRGQMYGFELSGDPVLPPNVLSVAKDSAAEKAGLKKGDRIAKIGEHAIANDDMAFYSLDAAYHDGKPLAIQLADGRSLTIPAVSVLDRSLGVYPTQILSTIDGLVLCVLLLAFDPFKRRDGQTFALLVSVYSVTRFFIESLRSDEAVVHGTGMSISQNVSILLIVGVIALWGYLALSKKPA